MDILIAWSSYCSMENDNVLSIVQIKHKINWNLIAYKETKWFGQGLRCELEVEEWYWMENADQIARILAWERGRTHIYCIWQHICVKSVNISVNKLRHTSLIKKHQCTKLLDHPIIHMPTPCRRHVEYKGRQSTK